MQSTVEPLEGNQVKLHVSVPAAEFEQAIDAAFRKIAREVRVDGFRPGKAPRAILERKFAAEGREQALRDGVQDYCRDAMAAEDLDAIAPAEIEITAGEEDGDVEFDAVVQIRPVVNLTGYDELLVELDYTPATDEQVEGQLDSLRQRFADLEDSPEPLVDGDYAQIDIAGSIDGEPVDALSATDFLYEVGSALVIDTLDEQLRGGRPGAILEFADVLPERFGERAGTEASFKVLVKEAKKKVLPELTDEWISEVTEFDTVEAAREDASKRLDMVARFQAQMALRDRALEELAGLVPVEAPEPLVAQEMEQRLHDLLHRLERQGLTIPQYLQATGQPQEEFLDGVRQIATRAVLSDLGLRAVVAQEEITASDDELEAEIARIAEQVSQKPQRVRRDLDKRGVLEAVRSDIARGKALEFVVDHARVVDRDGNPIELTLPDPAAPEPDESASPESVASTEVPEAEVEEESQA